MALRERFCYSVVMLQRALVMHFEAFGAHECNTCMRACRKIVIVMRSVLLALVALLCIATVAVHAAGHEDACVCPADAARRRLSASHAAEECPACGAAACPTAAAEGEHSVSAESEPSVSAESEPSFSAASEPSVSAESEAAAESEPSVSAESEPSFPAASEPAAEGAFAVRRRLFAAHSSVELSPEAFPGRRRLMESHEAGEPELCCCPGAQHPRPATPHAMDLHAMDLHTHSSRRAA